MDTNENIKLNNPSSDPCSQYFSDSATLKDDAPESLKVFKAAVILKLINHIDGVMLSYLTETRPIDLSVTDLSTTIRETLSKYYTDNAIKDVEAYIEKKNKEADEMISTLQEVIK